MTETNLENNPEANAEGKPESKPTLILKSRSTYIWAALAVGWLFDFLFWDKVPGISIAIYLIVLTVTGFLLANYQGVRPARSVYWLLVPLGFFSVMTFVRAEPMMIFVNVAASLFLLGMIAHSLQGGRWWGYRFKDYVTGAFFVGLDALIRPIAVFTSQPKREAAENGNGEERKGLKTSLAVLRGVLIALPIVLIFAAMLAEADPIFGEAFDNFVEIFNIENWSEYVVRAVLICIAGYLLLGVYLHALYKDHDTTLSTEESRWLPRFLGITEAAIVLGAVNLLFLAFVGIQFQYFFGGESNINLTGYTYAEYARRGFGELVAVAVFSLLLFLGLSFVTKKEQRGARRLFSVLGVALFALVSVILVSSFQRLLLYEDAYGFTRLRTYTHVFIIWLGALLLAVSLLELFQKQGYFALAALAAAISFVASLNVINVDGFIVRQNVARMANGAAVGAGEPGRDGTNVDISYLATLSEDAVPVLARLYQEADSPLEKEVVAGALTCHAAYNDFYDYENHPYQNYTWQSFHLARYQAQQEWGELSDGALGDDFTLRYGEDASVNQHWWEGAVIIGGEEVDCGGNWYRD